MTINQSQETGLVGFRKLIVYQKAKLLVLLIYQTTRRFPSFEKFGVTSQLQRAAVSVLLNIVEGHARGSKKDYAHFINIALGSCAEVEVLLELCHELEYLTDKDYLLLLDS